MLIYVNEVSVSAETGCSHTQRKRVVFQYSLFIWCSPRISKRTSQRDGKQRSLTRTRPVLRWNRWMETSQMSVSPQRARRLSQAVAPINDVCIYSLIELNHVLNLLHKSCIWEAILWTHCCVVSHLEACCCFFFNFPNQLKMAVATSNILQHPVGSAKCLLTSAAEQLTIALFLFFVFFYLLHNVF